MKIKVLSENRTNQPECLAEHGLSVYIETENKKILFDLGASDIFIQNAKRMKVNLAKVDFAVISHGHYDHTGGAPAFCELNQKAKLYIHENAFETTYGFEDGVLETEPCSIRWTEAQRNAIADRFSLTKDPVWFNENIVISGTIPKREEEKPTETFFIKTEDGGLIPDKMEHEQFLAIREFDEKGKSKGIFVFSGCSHNGVIPCLRYAKELFPGERILGFLAGMHLYNADKETRRQVLEQVTAEKMEYLLPVHCTGIDAICDLKILVGDRCIPAGVGNSYTF